MTTWWDRMLFPVKRAWLAVAARLKARKQEGGILKLHDDVQTCGYQDVQVMWDMMMRRSEKVGPVHTCSPTSKRKRSLSFSNQNSLCGYADPKHN